MADMTNQISNWAGGGATVTLGAAQTAYGLYKQRKNKRPTYEIPDEVKQNLTDAQHSALQGLPEEQRQMFLSNLERGAAMGLNQMRGRKGGLAGIAALNQNQNDAYGNLLSMDSAARMQNKGVLMQQRGVMADYKDQAFQLNKLNPYYEQTAQNQAMIGAGMQNMSQGFQSSNSGGSYGQGDQGKQQSQWNPASGNQYYTPANNQMGMVNYNPYSQAGQVVPDGQYANSRYTG